LAGHTLLVSLYGIMLATGFVLSNIELARQGVHTVLVIASAACTAVTIRLAPPCLPPWLRIVQNKYIVWIIMYRWMQYWRQRRQQPLDDASTKEIPWELYFAFFMSHVCMFFLGYYKCMIGDSTNQIEASRINSGHSKTSWVKLAEFSVWLELICLKWPPSCLHLRSERSEIMGARTYVSVEFFTATRHACKNNIAFCCFLSLRLHHSGAIIPLWEKAQNLFKIP